MAKSRPHISRIIRVSCGEALRVVASLRAAGATLLPVARDAPLRTQLQALA